MRAVKLAPAVAVMLLACSAGEGETKAGAAGDADPVAGRAVVVGGRQAQVTPCFTCHGLDGAGDGSGAFPRLAGQAAFYLYKQLIDYASGARPNRLMSPIAQQMSEKQMADVALYYSLQKVSREPSREPLPETMAALLDHGRRIATEGLPAAGVQACVYCHGRDGQGMPPSFPYLAGQYAVYSGLQMRLWQEGVRNNDPLDVMREIARRMRDEDIRAVSLYFESIAPAAGPAAAGARGE
mgnify:CR=1 FL=1